MYINILFIPNVIDQQRHNWFLKFVSFSVHRLSLSFPPFFLASFSVFLFPAFSLCLGLFLCFSLFHCLSFTFSLFLLHSLFCLSCLISSPHSFFLSDLFTISFVLHLSCILLPLFLYFLFSSCHSFSLSCSFPISLSFFVFPVISSLCFILCLPH